MKRNHKQMWRSVIALVLTFTLVFGTASTAFAQSGGAIAKQSDDPIVYVSLGDSMTNGYGLDGYDGESGILNYGDKVYANQFAAWLAGYEGEIANDQTIFKGENGTVDHRQLAMSGMRAEDLHWILDFDHTDAALAKRAMASRGTNTYGHVSETYRHWCSTENGVYPAEEMMKYRWYHDEENFGFKSGDYRTWWDLMDPDYRLANGAAEVLNTYYDTNNDAYGMYESSYAETVTKDGKTVTQHALDSISNPTYPEENENDYLEMGEQLWLQIATEFYQESVADADIISLALGNTNFGTFMFQYMKEIIANKEYSSRNNDFVGRYSLDDVYYVADFSPELKAEVEDLMTMIDGIIEENFDAESLPEMDPNVDEFDNMVDYIKYVIKYSVLSYVVNYVAVVERTLELNPDADIIQIALMNAYAAADNGEVEGTSMGELIDMLYDPLNAFIAALPTYLQMDGAYPDATFYYANCGTVETMSDVFGDDYYYDAEGNYLAYPGLDHSEVADVNDNSTARQRFVYWITGYCSRGNQHPGVGLCYCAHDGHKGNVRIDFGEFWKNVMIPVTDPAYKTADTDYNKAAQNLFGTFDLMFLMDNGTKNYQRLADYLKLSEEERWAALNDNTVLREETQTKNGKTYTFKYTKKDLAYSCEMYLAFEDAVIRAGKSAISVGDLGGYGSFDLSACQSAFNKFYQKQGITSITDPVEFKSYDDVKACFQNLSDALYEDPNSYIMLAMANRMEIGTGIGGHTSAGGHTDMYEKIKEVYKDGYTAQDEVERILLDYLNATYPNLMEAIGAAPGAVGNIDDLAIIVAMMKMSGNEALEGVDLDELEAQIRELNRYVDTELAPEDQAFVLELSNDVMDRTQNLASKATYTKYEPTEDSFYVSLGDSNVNGYGLEGYVDGMQNGLGQVVEGSAPVKLAKALYGDNWKDQFGQYAQGALRCEDMLMILGDETIEPDAYYDTEIAGNLLVKNDIKATSEKYIEAIKDADLISLAVGGGNVTTFVGRQVDLAVAGKEPVEMDWAKIGVETNETVKELNDLLDIMVPLVDKIGLLDKYLPEGMEVDNPANFARVLAESLLYGYASYNYYYPQVLDRIKEINPDAQLMILGMFNPVDDWTLETNIEGEDIVVPIGGIVNNLMEAANIQNLAYALQTENTTYVDLSDNITFLDAKIADGFEPTFADYYKEILEGNGKEVHANADGHEYMFNQMYNALQEEYLENYGKVFMENVWPLIEKYYDEAYAYAYEYADKEGYIDMTIEGIDEVIKALDEILAEANKTGISAELKAELADAVENAKATAEQLKVLIKEADVLDQATLDEAVALMYKLQENVFDVADIAKQAGIDTYKQLKKAYEYLKPIVIEKLKEAVAAGTEWLVAKIKEALPKADKALYDWFYNNPEDVINFFVEYSDEIKVITDKYGDEALAVLGYVLYTYGPDAVEWALENPEEAIDKWVQWYEKHGHKVWPMIDKYIKTMDEMGMFDDVKQALNDAYAEVEAMIIAYAEKVVAQLEAMLEELDAAARAALEELKAAIEAAKEDAEAGIADILAALEELYEQGVIAYEGATNGYYAATEDSYYVALGDTDVEYAEIVADELDLEDEQFVNYGIEDMTAAELRGYLEAGDEDLTAEVEKADLITLGFSNNTITKFAADKLAAVMAGETVDMDWTPYVGKDGAAAMDKAIAAIEEALVAEGADAEAINMVTTVVEAYAFACTEFACNYPEAINAIKAINPDAQVVVVGMYNPFENAVLDIEGTKVAVGEFVNVLVELANVHYLSYAMLTGNAIYVAAPDVEVEVPFTEAMGIDGFVSVLTDLDSLEPSAAGHEYIANQILDAMHVVSKAVYDAQKLIDEIKAFGDVTRENLEDAKALAEAARQAWDKLTDEEKELIGLENYKALVDFELAIAKVELGVAEDIAAAEKALAEAEAKAAEIARALAITESTVANLKAKVVNKSQIKVTWKAPETTPDQYRVALIRDGKKVSTTYISGEKTTVTLKNLLRGTNFTVRVTPVAKVDGQKYFSIYKTSNKVKTQLQKANLTVKKAGLKKQIISKDQNSTGFQIYISKDKNFKKDVKKLVYKTNKKGLNVKVKAKNFKKGTNYVKVRAYTKVNGKTVYGAWSGTVKVVK